MAIPFSKYVDITSGVGAATGVRRRDLIGRFFTTNTLLPPKSIIEFDSADGVREYFGTLSEEYLRAMFYFSWISKNITSPQKISFARWVNTETPPMIFGAAITTTLAAFKEVKAGALTLTLGADTHIVKNLSFENIISHSDVAAVVQAGIREAGTGPLWADAVVAFDAVNSRFNFTTTNASANAKIAISEGTINHMLGWNEHAIFADGALVESVSEVLTISTDKSNNFGSFAFMPTLSKDEIVEAATWNAAQNVMYQFQASVLSKDAFDYYEALKNYAGTGLTLAGAAHEYPEQLPMMILAATDYSRRNATQSYMFQSAALTPSVTEPTDSARLDALRINYYGRTQKGGQMLDLYQRGVLMGGASAPTDMNAYANEQWLNDAAGSAIMELLMSLANVSANAQGRGQLIATLQSVINQALINGTISVSEDLKPLKPTQQLYITRMTGNDNAWQQVQTIGYWLDCVMEPVVTEDSRTEYKAVYTLIYSKNDAIRKVEGAHVLI
ncbi:DUF3383 domain-containing protein [Mycoavidus sp. HKI]|uniref:DUF3383 domain-containing protein n=1 Tax=Mycoavidus sp. HKI TaxID=2840467 RepID=UPI001CBF632B|nr:DUF3383 domain-containing protein [Mycoavidus sp. HKI]UAW63487.1 DUF3383 domain-containing protein [Mycoavidus sp. HKI]